GGCRDDAALEYQTRFYSEKGRFPKHEIGELTGFDGSHFVRNAMRDRRIDGVFGDVAFDAKIVGTRAILAQASALRFHLVRGLPGAHDDFTNATHGLRV